MNARPPTTALIDRDDDTGLLNAGTSLRDVGLAALARGASGFCVASPAVIAEGGGSRRAANRRLCHFDNEDGRRPQSFVT